MADRIPELLTNENLRQAMIERRLEYSRQAAWQRTVEHALRVHEMVTAAN